MNQVACTRIKACAFKVFYLKKHYSVNQRHSSTRALPFEKSPSPIPLENSKAQRDFTESLQTYNEAVLKEPHLAVRVTPIEPFENDRNPKTGEEGGPRGPEPTRFGDWERKGRVTDF